MAESRAGVIYKTNGQFYDEIAAAIRDMLGETRTYRTSEMADAIRSIPKGGGSYTDDGNATADDILYGIVAYAHGQRLVGTIPVRSGDSITLDGAVINVPRGYYGENTQLPVELNELATPVITVSSTGLITARITQDEGYVLAGTKTATKQIDTVEQAEPVLTIGADGKIQAVATQTAGFVLAGTKTATLQLTVRSELAVDGFNVTAQAGYYPNAITVRVDSATPGTATPATILKGYIAWVNGERIVGTYEPGSGGGTSGITLNDFTSVVYALESVSVLDVSDTWVDYDGSIVFAGINSVNASTVVGLDSITVLTGTPA